MIVPSSSRTGDTHSDISIKLPSLRCHCASLTLDAVILPKQPGSGATLADADVLARTLGLAVC
jgi:hypothetical protein